MDITQANREADTVADKVEREQSKDVLVKHETKVIDRRAEDLKALVQR
jgi:hypothetical protein